MMVITLDVSMLGSCRSLLMDDLPSVSSAISFAAVCNEGVSSDTPSISMHLCSVLFSLRALTTFRKWQAQYPLIFEVSKPTKKPVRRFLKFG